MRYIAGISRQQLVLFPESLDDYIAADNPVRFIDAFVDSLDLAELGFAHTELAETGRPPYDPRDLLKLYIYGSLASAEQGGCICARSHRRYASLLRAAHPPPVTHHKLERARVNRPLS